MTADVEMEDSQISVVVTRGISPVIQVELEPAGHWYHQYEHYRMHGGDDEKVSESDNSDDSKESESKVIIEHDSAFLQSLDPRKWKDQDHYQVLGLHKYRYKAKDADIKKAHRQMMLNFHPDKRKAGGEAVLENDDFITNITKAYEVLGDPTKRRSYDSVDPLFDDKVPGDKLSNKDKFYEVFGVAFDRNSRWSLRKHVPQLGGPDATKEQVDLFYEFWYNFDSWREFSYLDEEDKEKGEDRDERRWIDKQNKAERAVRKKEENARIRKLVDNSYKLDSRVAKFKEEERNKRSAGKKARQEAARLKQEQEIKERERQEEEARKQKEKEEADLKIRLAREKKERDIMKKELKNERKIMRTLCKEEDYFIKEDRERVQAMIDVDTLCDGLQLLQLKDLIQRVQQSKEDKQQTRSIIKQEVNDLRTGKLENINIINVTASSSNSSSSNGTASNKSKTTINHNSISQWSHEELQLLIKAVNLFPAGTAKRWDVVAQYLSQHGPNKVTRPSKEVLGKAKELQNTDTSQLMRDAANKNAMAQQLAAGDKLEAKGGAPGEASLRLETPQEMLGINLSPWSAEEQSRLEQALKTYPASTTDRWETIAASISGRSKKDCMRRYKELAEMVKAKKAAMLAAGVKK